MVSCSQQQRRDGDVASPTCVSILSASTTISAPTLLALELLEKTLVSRKHCRQHNFRST